MRVREMPKNKAFRRANSYIFVKRPQLRRNRRGH